MPVLVRFFIASIFLTVLDVYPCVAENMESPLKAAYMLNFIKFTEWPEGSVADNKLTLCVAGNQVLDGTLAKLQGRQAGNYELHVAHISSESLSAEAVNYASVLGHCHVVYIGDSERQHFLPIIKSLADSPILTVSEIDDFAELGGSIELLHRENKIIFAVNLAAVQRSKLRLSAQFLNLASYIFRK